MAINKTMRKVLKALSYDGIEVERARQFANLKALDPLKIFHKKMDTKIYNGEHEVPVRIFFPDEETLRASESGEHTLSILLYFHGGGWVTDSLDNYERICSQLAVSTNYAVAAVDYRLAPEHKFPAGLEDCYAVAKALYTGQMPFPVNTEELTIIGDSAGGNLTAAVCQMARDRGEFMPKRQILIYPATNNDYTDTSPYESVRTNGTDFLLTAGKMEDYLTLYENTPEDRQNPYFAPILAKDFSGLPKALVITAEYDPLRDEGEDYGKKLKEAGIEVQIYRIKDALHGFFALGIKYMHVEETMVLINRFLREE